MQRKTKLVQMNRAGYLVDILSARTLRPNASQFELCFGNGDAVGEAHAGIAAITGRLPKTFARVGGIFSGLLHHKIKNLFAPARFNRLLTLWKALRGCRQQGAVLLSFGR